MKGTFATIFGLIFTLAALAAWYYTDPAPQTGWILFIAFVGTLGMLGVAGRRLALKGFAGLLIAVAAGAAWWKHLGTPNDGYALGLCVICAISALIAVNGGASKGSGAKKK